MNLDTPHLPYEGRTARRGSSSFTQRLGKAMPMPLRGWSVADWLQIASIVVSALVIWIALYYTR